MCCLGFRITQGYLYWFTIDGFVAFSSPITPMYVDFFRAIEMVLLSGNVSLVKLWDKVVPKYSFAFQKQTSVYAM